MFQKRVDIGIIPEGGNLKALLLQSSHHVDGAGAAAGMEQDRRHKLTPRGQTELVSAWYKVSPGAGKPVEWPPCPWGGAPGTQIAKDMAPTTPLTFSPLSHCAAGGG